MNEIHDRIKSLRLAKKLSMEALAARVGVTWQTVQQWEKVGGTAPKRTRLAEVAAALDTTPEYLSSGRIENRVGENDAPYNITRLAPGGNSPLLIELINACKQLNDRGMIALIERAHALAAIYPAEAKHSSSQ